MPHNTEVLNVKIYPKEWKILKGKVHKERMKGDRQYSMPDAIRDFLSKEASC